jgi:hypothetical protein
MISLLLSRKGYSLYAVFSLPSIEIYYGSCYKRHLGFLGEMSLPIVSEDSLEMMIKLKAFCVKYVVSYFFLESELLFDAFERQMNSFLHFHSL